ncbi:MAG: NHL repeat-containing protein [Candidatus Limnocylindrales bacterium]
MTASPSAAQPVPGTQPTPGADAAPPDGLGSADVDQAPPEKRRRKLLILLLLLAGFVMLLGLAIWYLLFRQPIPIPTIPGETIMPGYVTSVYGASRPMGVAVNAAGDRIYVGATAGDQTALIFDAQGNELGKLLPPTSTGSSHVPVYLAVNPLTGDVYVSDRPTASIYVYDAQGTYLRAFTPPADIAGWQPLGISFDAAGNLYVTDVGHSPNVVREFDPTGKQVRVLGEAAGLNFPNAVAIDDAGFAYVTDSNNGRLVVFAQDGSIVARVSRGVGQGNLGLPRGVALDAQGRVYVVDASGHTVFVYAQYQEGTSRLDYLGAFGSQGIANGAFAYPNGIAVDARGRLYVADSANDRVQLWSY